MEAVTIKTIAGDKNGKPKTSVIFTHEGRTNYCNTELAKHSHDTHLQKGTSVPKNLMLMKIEKNIQNIQKGFFPS